MAIPLGHPLLYQIKIKTLDKHMRPYNEARGDRPLQFISPELLISPFCLPLLFSLLIALEQCKLLS